MLLILLHMSVARDVGDRSEAMSMGRGAPSLPTATNCEIRA